MKYSFKKHIDIDRSLYGWYHSLGIFTLSFVIVAVAMYIILAADLSEPVWGLVFFLTTGASAIPPAIFLGLLSVRIFKVVKLLLNHSVVDATIEKCDVVNAQSKELKVSFSYTMNGKRYSQKIALRLCNFPPEYFELYQERGNRVKILADDKDPKNIMIREVFDDESLRTQQGSHINNMSLESNKSYHFSKVLMWIIIIIYIACFAFGQFVIYDVFQFLRPYVYESIGGADLTINAPSLFRGAASVFIFLFFPALLILLAVLPTLKVSVTDGPDVHYQRNKSKMTLISVIVIALAIPAFFVFNSFFVHLRVDDTGMYYTKTFSFKEKYYSWDELQSVSVIPSTDRTGGRGGGGSRLAPQMILKFGKNKVDVWNRGVPGYPDFETFKQLIDGIENNSNVAIDVNTDFSYNWNRRYDNLPEEHTIKMVFNYLDRIGASYRRGMEALDNKEYDTAITEFAEVIRLKADYADAYYNRGNAYRGKDDYANAVADYTEVIRLTPQFDEVYFYRALMFRRLGDDGRAIADYTEAIRLDPGFTNAYYNRGIIYVEKNEYDLAIADYTDAIRLNPNYTNAYFNRAIAHSGKGDYDGAIADYTEAIRLNPNDAGTYNNRGVAYYNKRDYTRAIEDYEAALRINPDYAMARRNLDRARQAR